MAWIAVACIVLVLSQGSSESTCHTNESPVIGILVQDYLGDIEAHRSNSTFIPATYVKFVETSGGRGVPVHTDQSVDYYNRILNQINGIVLPGGDQDTVNSSYTRTARIIYDHAIASNEKGVYFPVWAVCQGMQVLAYLTAGKNPLHSCPASDYVTPLNFTMNLKHLNDDTKLFHRLSIGTYSEVVNNPVVFQWHHLCLTKGTYRQSSPLYKNFKVLATNLDMDGGEYVSIMESYKHPIYGVMFHPEEVMFSFQVKENHTSVPHTAHALHTAQYFTNFFADECRKNPNQMDKKVLEKQVIYNFVPEHTTDTREPYDLCYFFPIADYGSLFRDE